MAVTSALAALVVALAAASVAINAAAYSVAARAARRFAGTCPLDDEPPVPWPARALAAARAFAVESAALAFALAAAPLGARPLRVRAAAGDGRRPVLLVPDRARQQATFLALAHRLRRDGWAHLYIVPPRALRSGIEPSAGRVAGLVERLRRESGACDVDVVAHGAGGLVARACVRALGERGGVVRLITLGTPHQGSAALGLAGLGGRARELRPGAPLLRRLASDDALPARVECTSIYSTDDARVVPPGNAYWPGAFNVQIQGVGHLSLLFSRRVYTLVRENLAAPLDLPAASAASTRA
jgi:triacylglycerol esterase/lipase EstA (alpha/beta hydrolase family)